MRLAIPFALALLVFARSAHASDNTRMTTGAAAHAAHVSHDEITWRSLYVDNRGGEGPLRLELARPLAATLDEAASPGVTAVLVNRAITAFEIDPELLPAWRSAIVVTLHAPYRANDALLEPPLAQGDVAQRVVVSGDDEVRFEPSDPAIERHVEYAAPLGSRESDRRACDEALGAHDRPPLDDVPLYLTGADGVRGVHGHFTTRPERAHAGVFAAMILFVLITILLALAYRRLSGRARVERAEAILIEEYGGDWRNR